jgi:methyl acetate hydrolase
VNGWRTLWLGGLLVAGSAMAAPELDSAGRAALDAYLEKAVADTYIPGIVAFVTSADRVLYSRAVGIDSERDGRAMREDAIFGIASMTKPITALAIEMLVEEGRLTLDDAVEGHLPGVISHEVFASFDAATKRYTTRPARTELTVRHLMTNTSGLGYPWVNATLFALLGNAQPSPSVTTLPLLFDPGTRWEYGESMRVLGTIAAKLSGQPLEALYRARIFAPLGMDDTGWTVSDTARDRVVAAYRKVDSQLEELPKPQGPIGATARGDGGLYSTGADYAKFLRVLLRGGVTDDGTRLVAEESIAAMRRNQIGQLRVERQSIADPSRARPFPVGAGRDRFGLGFQLTEGQTDPELRADGSISWAGIQNTEFWVDPERGIGAILLMQYLPFYDETAIATLEGFERTVNRNLR